MRNSIIDSLSQRLHGNDQRTVLAVQTILEGRRRAARRVQRDRQDLGAWAVDSERST